MRVYFILITVLLLPVALPAFGQDTAKADANQFAARTGAIAGAATFCKLEADLVENYIDRAQALIASQTDDDVGLVVARIGFTSSFNISSSKEPAGGCPRFAKEFPALVKAINE